MPQSFVTDAQTHRRTFLVSNSTEVENLGGIVILETSTLFIGRNKVICTIYMHSVSVLLSKLRLRRENLYVFNK